MTSETLLSALQGAVTTDMFAAGLALGSFGLMVAFLRVQTGHLARLLWSRIAFVVTVDNRSDAHRHFSVWLDASGALVNSRRQRVSEYQRQRNSSAQATSMLVPAQGRHWFIRDAHVCIVNSHTNEKVKIGHGQLPLEEMELTLIGRRPRIVLDWLAEGRQIAARDAARKAGPSIQVMRDGYWENCGEVRARKIQTLVAEDDTAAHILRDMTRFYASEDWYLDRGIPWRRGYLLHGPPGTGKSSLIRVLASELGKDIATLDIGRRRLSDDQLVEGMMDAPRDAILVIEDVDAIFTGRDRQTEGEGISFSGLLNAIDGVAAQEGRALIMTTNHRDRLDPALIRPGRADLHIEVGPIGAAASMALFLRFFPGEHALAGRFGERIGATRHPVSAVQGWLLAHADDPVIAATAEGLAPVPALAAE